MSARTEGRAVANVLGVLALGVTALAGIGWLALYSLWRAILAIIRYQPPPLPLTREERVAEAAMAERVAMEKRALKAEAKKLIERQDAILQGRVCPTCGEVALVKWNMLICPEHGVVGKRGGA